MTRMNQITRENAGSVWKCRAIRTDLGRYILTNLRLKSLIVFCIVGALLLFYYWSVNANQTNRDHGGISAAHDKHGSITDENIASRIASIRQEIKSKPNDADLHHELGLMLYEDKQYSAAITEIKKRDQA